MGFFDKIREGLKKTKDAMMRQVEGVIHSFTKVDEEFLEELEEVLIMSDMGAATASDICGRLRKKIKETGVNDTAAVKDMLKAIIADMLREEEPMKLSTSPSILFVIGVNGAGKTTTIGKLAAGFKAQGKRVLVGAADTFRAAAIEQLEVWAERAGVPLIKHKEGADPAAVVFDALSAARARGTDVVLVDTAGRLHNKQNLMNELNKISRVVDRELPGCARETLLVLDATTGQNGLIQAKQFQEAAGITGIVLTKLDGTAKGGIAIAIARELGVPVKYAGVGEGIDDLRPFDALEFAQALI